MSCAHFARSQRIKPVDVAVSCIVRRNVNWTIGEIIASFAFRCRKFCINGINFCFSWSLIKSNGNMCFGFSDRQLLPLNNARSGHFSRRTSSRASLTSIGRIRQVAEKMVAAVPKDTSDPTTLDDEHDGIINEKIAIVEQNCDEKMVAVDDKNAAKKLIAALEAVSVQPTSTTLDISSSVIEPEKKSRISRSKMLETVETVAVVPKAVLLPPDSVVIVAYVRDHKTVVVRRMAMRGESDQHKQLIEMAIAGGINAERITSRPGVGDIVLALSNVHSMYGRACVEQINGRAALVYFLEFGCNETVDASNIKVIPDALGSSPCLLNEVTLTGVPASAKDPEKIVQYLTKLNHDQTLLQLKYADGKVSRVLPWKIRIEGELIDVRTSASINQKAIELNAPAPLISVVSESVALSESMENLSSCENVIELPHKGFSGEKVAVLVLDNSLLKLGYVSGIRVTDSAIFGENDERVNAYGMQVAKDPPFLPK